MLHLMDLLYLCLYILGVCIILYCLLKIFYPCLWIDLRELMLYHKLFGYVHRMTTHFTTIAQIFEEKAKIQPERTFIVFEDQRYTYGTVLQQINVVAKTTFQQGLGIGDHVAMFFYNEPAFIWTYLGLMKIGVKMAFINTNLRGSSLLHCIQICEARVLIIGQGQELIQAIEEIYLDLQLLNMDIWVQGSVVERLPHGFQSFDKLIVLSSEKSINFPQVKTNPNDVGVFIFTSGTTGLPKAANVSYYRISLGGVCFLVQKLSNEDVFYITLPLYHSSASILFTSATINLGASMVLRKKFSASNFWHDCYKYNVTVIAYIGEMLRYLVATPETPYDRKHKVKLVTGNGLRPDIWKKFESRFNIPLILEFYAATESNIGFFNFFNHVGSCGRSSPILKFILPCSLIKFDVENEEPIKNEKGYCISVKEGEVGLLIAPMRNHGLSFRGYKGNKELSDKKILHDVFRKGDAYFNTGDLFLHDNIYNMYFKDRIGDTYRWKGENVSTQEVSEVLAQLLFVQDANVYGVLIQGHEGRAGMVALVLKDDSQDLSEEQRKLFYNQVVRSLPSYAQPRFLRILNTMTLTGTFKYKKTELKADGFDPAKLSDKLYYLNIQNKDYVNLTNELYKRIISGEEKL